MNPKTVADVTRALDATITKVAREQLRWLSSGLPPSDIANEVHRSLRSFQELKRVEMPDYNEWDALLYALWYQPSQINLAYTLACTRLEKKNPLRTGSGSLQVVDFGCGALAMQFGLALAAADSLEERGIEPRVAIVSEDNSVPMRDIGLNLWANFVNEINDPQKYPELKALRQVCREMRLDDRGESSFRWLTVLHVAYPEAVDEIKTVLDSRVMRENPNLILVTMNNIVDSQLAYSPQNTHEYTLSTDEVLLGRDLEIRGKFAATTEFRRKLYAEHIAGKLSETDDDFVKSYLTRIATQWIAPKSDAHVKFWYKRDELPW